MDGQHCAILFLAYSRPLRWAAGWPCVHTHTLGPAYTVGPFLYRPKRVRLTEKLASSLTCFRPPSVLDSSPPTRLEKNPRLTAFSSWPFDSLISFFFFRRTGDESGMRDRPAAKCPRKSRGSHCPVDSRLVFVLAGQRGDDELFLFLFFCFFFTRKKRGCVHSDCSGGFLHFPRHRGMTCVHAIYQLKEPT